MCFGGSRAPATPTPAAPPAPPSLPAEQQQIGRRRRRENKRRFGNADGPTTRRDSAGLNSGDTGSTGIKL